MTMISFAQRMIDLNHKINPASRKMTKQEYYDLASDTEDWWAETYDEDCFGPGLIKAPPGPCDWDFRAQIGDRTLYYDVKFHRTPYRTIKGCIERSVNGITTGIVNVAEKHLNDPNVEVYVVVLESAEGCPNPNKQMTHAGWYYIYDVKALLQTEIKGEIPLIQRQQYDVGYQRNGETVYWQMNDWEDRRFLCEGGPLPKKHWKPKTHFGKNVMRIDDWFLGKWII
jgi:hypothetical protein